MTKPDPFVRKSAIPALLDPSAPPDQAASAANMIDAALADLLAAEGPEGASLVTFGRMSRDQLARVITPDLLEERWDDDQLLATLHERRKSLAPSRELDELQSLIRAGKADTDSLARMLDTLDAVQDCLTPGRLRDRLVEERVAETPLAVVAARMAELRDALDNGATTDEATAWRKTEALRTAIAEAKERAEAAAKWPRMLPISDDGGEPEPVPVLYVPGTSTGVLAKREVGILTASGGSGKSYLTLQWGVAAALGRVHEDRAAERYEQIGRIASGGLAAAPGKWLYLGYEDSRSRVAHRFQHVQREPGLHSAFERAAADGIKPLDIDPHCQSLYLRGYPLFGVNPRDHMATMPVPLDAWDRVWSAAEAYGPDCVVIDPAMSAYLAGGNDIATVRAFIDHLYARAEALGCAILIVHHSSKQGRGPMRGEDNPGNVAGSVAWVDAARTVLCLGRAEKVEIGERDRKVHRLWAEKTNHYGGGERWLSKSTYDDGRSLAGFADVTSEVQQARAAKRSKDQAEAKKKKGANGHAAQQTFA